MVHLKYNNIALGNYFGEPFAFGKDEVPGPNPGISSKAPEAYASGAFSSVRLKEEI